MVIVVVVASKVMDNVRVLLHAPSLSCGNCYHQLCLPFLCMLHYLTNHITHHMLHRFFFLSFSSFFFTLQTLLLSRTLFFMLYHNSHIFLASLDLLLPHYILFLIIATFQALTKCTFPPRLSFSLSQSDSTDLMAFHSQLNVAHFLLFHST